MKHMVFKVLVAGFIYFGKSVSLNSLYFPNSILEGGFYSYMYETQYFDIKSLQSNPPPKKLLKEVCRCIP